MPHTFDATLKNLARDYPAGFVALFDGPTNLPISVLDTDLSAVTTSADLVVGLGTPLREVVHIDFQSGASANKHREILVYNALLHKTHKVPVRSIVILLRRNARHKNMNGVVSYAASTTQGKMIFEYQMVKLWDIPAENFVEGDLGLIPLAPLGKLPDGLSKENGLQKVIQNVVNRLLIDEYSEKSKELLTATYLLSGLVTSPEKAKRLFKGVRAVKESSTYMAILEEGIEKGIEKGKIEMLLETILRLGTKRFGKPTPATEKRLLRIQSRKRLEELTDKILDAKSWDELLAK